ncbi:MAG: glycoside hydrolase family 9 protein [Sedimentisphaerales bacterium]|nr:glycoside hydrolase family 9 protein [Sedimentisphaerales bacterium]
MHWLFCGLLVLSGLLSLGRDLEADQVSTAIRLNTIGYLPGYPKVASIAADCQRFSVLRKGDNAVVLEGIVTGPVSNADTGEQIYLADFSSVIEPGSYQLDVPGVGRSPVFRIAEDLYVEPFYLVMRGMYLWRCGTAVRAVYKGQVFEHGACHLQDAWLDLIIRDHVRKDGTKGWHDAGDYNKYVVNAGVTVGCLLRAWEDFPAVSKLLLDIPESGGQLPDFLAEVKWELDWLLTMQDKDGSVFHKLSTKDFGGFILPEQETTDRYFVPWSSAATADFTAMMAMASRHLRPYDPNYAQRCLDAAWKAYGFLKAHPDNHDPDMKGVTTGAYTTKDPDDRLWAAAELWEATGDPDVLADLEDRIRAINCKVDIDFDWGSVANLGLFTYVASSRPNREPNLVQRVSENILSVADQIVSTARSHGYARPLGSRYYWGCNGSVARQSLVLMAAYRFQPRPEYMQTCLDAINHLFGRNCHGRSYVTGLGYMPPMYPHDRRSGADKVVDPWPGYLVGGPWPRAMDWNDVQSDYRTNEIAINWNAALIYALAAFPPQ